MIETLFWIFYAIGAAWCWRFLVRMFRSDAYTDRVEAMFLGTACTLFAGWVWPLIAGGRITYVLWQKYGPDDTRIFDVVFPVLDKPETRSERERRLRREAEKELEAYRRFAEREFSS